MKMDMMSTEYLTSFVYFFIRSFNPVISYFIMVMKLIMNSRRKENHSAILL